MSVRRSHAGAGVSLRTAGTDAAARVADSRTKRFLVIDLLRLLIFGIISAGNQPFPLVKKYIIAKAKIGVRL